MEGRFAVIVDGYHVPYGDIRGYASAFRDRGVEPVAVMSSPAPLRQFLPRWFPEDYAAVHFFDGDLDALIAIVKGYDPVCIVAGQEIGVELAATLVDAVLPGSGNVAGSAPSQRDKGEMVAALERAGVPRLRTVRSADPEVISAWIRDNGLENKPLVLKPPKSGGTDGVHLAAPGADWRGYFDKLLGTVNDLGILNDEIVVQEYAAGTEYIVDLYSVNGEHGVCDVCVYAKHARNARIGIYDTMDFVSPDASEVPELVAYAKLAATAVGIRNGPTHAEIMLTEDGPRLIELGARYSGGPAMLATRLATGDNQIARAVRHRLDGEFTPGYQLDQPVRVMFLSAEQDGVVSDIDILGSALDLPTVHKLSLPSDGAQVRRTDDLHTNLGWMIQVGPDWAAIETDYRGIRKLERQWNARQTGAVDG